MALATAGSGSQSGPMSIEEITSEAEGLLSEYTDIIPLRFWLRSAVAIQNQAHSYERDGNDEEAFKFFYRHALLVMNKLANHPELSDPANHAAWKKAQSDVKRNLGKLEILKPRIKKRFDEYSQLIAQTRAEREKLQKQHRNASYSALVGGTDSIDVDLYARATELDPAKDVDFAVRLAKYRSIAQQPQRPPTSHAKQSQSSLPSSSNRQDRGRSFLYDESDEELSNNMRAISSRQRENESAHSPKAPNIGDSNQIQLPRYPTVPRRVDKQESSWYKDSPGSSPSPNLRSVPLAPTSDALARPPKEPLSRNIDGPPVPQKTQAEHGNSATGLNSKNYTFATSETTESGAPLRTIFLNPKLRDNFLTIALANTHRNLETCGILCGELISNAFFISKLVIPEQESTSDTCDTVNEGALFDYCDSNNLMTLGWIHTHPSQSCFMSSRDLHTHGGYQVQLPESIAIVCAPRHTPSWGIFRLTDPPGLSAILTCKQTGLFHPHAEKNIYTTALQPGHVREVDNLPFEVVDLRPETSWI